MRAAFKGLGLLIAIVGVYHWLIRSRFLTWGSTAEEVERMLPGDEISPSTPFRSTMAISIKASPREIWPWLVQMGWNRGGFYSYNRIETLFRMDLHNADRIHPEWQGLNVGDTIWMGHPSLEKAFPQTRVSTLDPNRALVLGILGPAASEADSPSGAWSFVLDSIDADTTRLIARLQVYPPKIGGQLFFYLFIEPAHFIMQRGGLRGVKVRAEQHRLDAISEMEPAGTSDS